MQSPNNENENTAIPPAVETVEVVNKAKSSFDSISQLSPPSAVGGDSFSSPIGTKDIGQPRTPEGRVLVAIDEDAIDQGYDSDGQGAPWVGINEDILVGPEVEEDPLPIGPRPSSPVVPSPEIVAKKVPTIDEVVKMKVVDLKTELKKRGLCIQEKKTI